MARYFFNRLGGRSDLDPEGVELDSLDHARVEAVAFAADTLRDDGFAFWDGSDVRIEVMDDAGTLLIAIVISVVDGVAESLA